MSAVRRRFVVLVLVLALVTGVGLSQVAVPLLPPVSPPTIAWDVVVAIAAGVSVFAFQEEINSVLGSISTWLGGVTRSPTPFFPPAALAEAGMEYEALPDTQAPGAGGGGVTPGVQAVSAWLTASYGAAVDGVWSNTYDVGDYWLMSVQPGEGKTILKGGACPVYCTVDSGLMPANVGVSDWVGAAAAGSQAEAMLASLELHEVCAATDPSMATPTMRIADGSYSTWCGLMTGAPSVGQRAIPGDYQGLYLDGETLPYIGQYGRRVLTSGRAAGWSSSTTVTYWGQTVRHGAVYEPYVMSRAGYNDIWAWYAPTWSEYYVIPWSVSADGGAWGIGSATMTGYELVAVDSVGQGGTWVSARPEWHRTYTVRSVATASFPVLSATWGDAEGNAVDGYWSSAWISSFVPWFHMAWHSVLWHWVRGNNSLGFEYPAVALTIEVDGGSAVMPWDEAAAPEFGTAVQTGTGSDVWWLVNPVAALQAAFVPSVGLAARADSLVDTLEQRWPFSLAASLSFVGSVGSGPISVAAIDLGRIGVQADNAWLNQLGQLTRLVATGLLATLLFVWIRGKVMPKVVV